MARKLYVLNGTGKAQVNGKSGSLWMGSLGKPYGYLGDYAARILDNLPAATSNRLTKWVHCPVPVSRPVRCKASRLDVSFRGWGL